MIVISPISGTDGLFSILHDDSYGLYGPDNTEASSTYCTASTTPMYDDCNVSPLGNLGLGSWVAVDASSTARYDYVGATTTADKLLTAWIQQGGALANSGVPIAIGGFGVGIAFLVLALILGAFQRATPRRGSH